MIHAVLVDWVLGFHQILYFALSCNFLKFWHLKQAISRKFDILKNILIPTEPEKGTTIYMIRWVPQALQKDCLPYASRHADVTCMQWQWDIFFIGKISPKGEIQNSKFGKEVFL